MLQTPEESKKAGVGVVVGRFQVPELHEGHIELLQSVRHRHEAVIVVLGVSALRCSKNNPLDFQARKIMLESLEIVDQVHYIKDRSSDKNWSKALDEIVSTAVPPGEEITLYGSRDSFKDHYSGRYTVKELLQKTYISGSEVRRQAHLNVTDTRDFRKGVIWAVGNQYPTAYPTVDIAIVDEVNQRLLLGRKPGEEKYRFIGGFAEPGASLEDSARREVREETGLEVGDLEYLGSAPINDWRYRSEVDGIVTTLFKAQYSFGRPVPDDDIEELCWFDIDQLKKEEMMEIHWGLLDMFEKKFAKKTQIGEVQ